LDDGLAKATGTSIVSGYEGAMVLASEAHHRANVSRQPCEAVMNFPTPVTESSDRHDAAQISTDAMQQIAAPFSEAANDADFYRNPLWVVVGAFGLLFTLLALLVASG
jgi:hypothetical protein